MLPYPDHSQLCDRRWKDPTLCQRITMYEKACPIRRLKLVKHPGMEVLVKPSMGSDIRLPTPHKVAPQRPSWVCPGWCNRLLQVGWWRGLTCSLACGLVVVGDKSWDRDEIHTQKQRGSTAVGGQCGPGVLSDQRIAL